MKTLQIKLNSEEADTFVSAMIFNSMQSLDSEIDTLLEKTFLMSHEQQDLHDARQWLKSLKCSYKYYSIDKKRLLEIKNL